MCLVHAFDPKFLFVSVTVTSMHLFDCGCSEGALEKEWCKEALLKSPETQYGRYCTGHKPPVTQRQMMLS